MTRPLERLADRPLLVGLDYDGTLAPIVDRPEDARPQPGARDAVQRIARAGRHRVVIVTGRRAAEVHAFLEAPAVDVIGLHGMEWPGEAVSVPDRAAIDAVIARVPGAPGVRVEDKGRTVAVHYRNVPADARANVEAALDALEPPAGWEVISGKMVREFRPEGFGKGRAFARVVAAHPDLHPVFVGDDDTDEQAFEAALDAGGTAVKVGPGPTVAPYRLPDAAAVVRWLATLGA